MSCDAREERVSYISSISLFVKEEGGRIRSCLISTKNERVPVLTLDGKEDLLFSLLAKISSGLKGIESAILVYMLMSSRGRDYWYADSDFYRI